MSASKAPALKELWTRFGNERTAIILVVLAFLMVTIDRGYFWSIHPLHQAPDQTVYLDTAKWIMEGKVPYRDFFDWNPPLIMYLSMIPHMISMIFPFHPIMSLNLLVIVSTFVSACASLYIAYRYLGRDEFYIFIPMCAGATFLIFEQQFDMAEREQLFMIMYLPFMTLRYAVWTLPGIKVSRPLALITGIVAGLGLALKPQFCGAHAAFELVLLARNGRLKKRIFRTEIFGVLLVMVLYASYLAFLLPKEAWDVLKDEIMPLFVYGYEYSTKGLMFMLHGGPYFYLPITMLCYAMATTLFANRFSQWAAPLAAFTLVNLFNYLHGDQAWIYRMIPMVSGSYLLCGLGVGLVGMYLYKHTRAPKAVATCLLATFLLTASIYTFWDLKYTIEDYHSTNHFHNLQDIGAYVGWTPCPPTLDLHPIFMVMMKYTNVGDKVLYMGTGINDGYPAIVQSGRKLATRYPFCPLIIVNHCIISRPKEEKTKWEQLMYKQIENYKQDIIRDKPDMILLLDYPPFIDVLRRYGFFERCLNGYMKYTKEYDVLVYLPEWNWYEEPVREEPNPKSEEAPPGEAPPTTGDQSTGASSGSPSTAKEAKMLETRTINQEAADAEAAKYPDLPTVPPPTARDTDPPDEVVVPPPKWLTKQSKKKKKPAKNSDSSSKPETEKVLPQVPTEPEQAPILLPLPTEAEAANFPLPQKNEEPEFDLPSQEPKGPAGWFDFLKKKPERAKRKKRVLRPDDPTAEGAVPSTVQDLEQALPPLPPQPKQSLPPK